MRAGDTRRGTFLRRKSVFLHILPCHSRTSTGLKAGDVINKAFVNFGTYAFLRCRTLAMHSNCLKCSREGILQRPAELIMKST